MRTRRGAFTPAGDGSGRARGARHGVALARVLLLASAGLLATAGLLASAGGARAQDTACPRCTDVGEAPDALPGISDVPVAVLRPAMGGAVVGAGGLGLAIGEPWEGAERYRVHGSVAGAFHPLDWLAIGLRMQGRWEQVDRGEGAGGDVGMVGFPSLTLRATVEPAEGLGLALDASVWMLGAQAPSLEPASTSLRARAVGSYRFAIDEARVTLTASAGGLLDNSRGAAPRAITDRLSDEDRLSLGISDFSAVVVGVGGIVRIGIAEIFAEASYRALVGDGAPSAGASPLHVVAGARLRPLGELLEIGAYADVLASEADAALVAAGGPAAPIDPRFTLTLAIGVRLGWEGNAPHDEREGDLDGGGGTGEPIPSGSGRIDGRVSDEAGAPVEGARVEVVPAAEGAAPLATTTDVEGRWSIDGVPAGPARVIIRREGRDPIESTIEVRPGESAALASAFPAALPAGEIRGTIQGSDGRPLEGAEIRIRPTGQVLSTDADGAFEAEVPPGSYEVEVRAAGHRAQTRRVEVAERGVVLLNAQLHRAR